MRPSKKRAQGGTVDTHTRLRVLVALLLGISANPVFAEEPAGNGPESEAEGGAVGRAPSPWDTIHFSTLWYLYYGYGAVDGEGYNGVGIGRGYLTFELTPTDWFEPRVTVDAHQDDDGNFALRLKYLYAKFVAPLETAVVTEPNLEFGLVHGPWLDFEEHVDNYRMQGTMFVERVGVLNSADAGVTAATLLGRKLPGDYRKRVSGKYPGTWGSVAAGLYNGGGYHAAEANEGKVFESRVSLRPLGPWLPNLQLSHFFIWGTGNTPPEVCDDAGNCIPGAPDWRLNAFTGSFEHPYFVVTGQYALGRGNQKGSQIDEEGEAIDLRGASGFAEVKLPWIRSSLVGRYDWWKWGDSANQRLIVGYALHFLDHDTLLVDFDRALLDDGGSEDWRVRTTLQVKVP